MYYTPLKGADREEPMKPNSANSITGIINFPTQQMITTEIATKPFLHGAFHYLFLVIRIYIRTAINNQIIAIFTIISTKLFSCLR